jgi:hypothetical protein
VTQGAILLKDPAEWSVLLIEGINEFELIKILNVYIGVDATIYHEKT